MCKTGYIHSYESLAAVDGDGLRYGVFMSGCPLRCVCCHNPDTWNMQAGTQTDAAALVRKLARYKTYFKDTGGVTFSGGEPLCQAAFLREVADLLKKEGIRYILDTSGAVPLTEDVRYLLLHAQGILLDIKYASDEAYRRYTGAGMAMPLAMLDFLCEHRRSVTVRTVVIPGINDSEEAMDGYVSLLKGRPIRRYELLPFHTMGFHKYEALGLDNPLLHTAPQDADALRRLQAYADARLRFNAPTFP